MKEDYSEYYCMVENMGKKMMENNPDKIAEINEFITGLVEKLARFEAEHNIK